jgi:hypothetical protein
MANNLTLWPRLIKYIYDGRFHIDNNLIENSIRSVAPGRKNYLFAGSHEAAQQAAVIYSLLGTCKINGIEPFSYLTVTLSAIPDHMASQLHTLLPGQNNHCTLTVKAARGLRVTYFPDYSESNSMLLPGRKNYLQPDIPYRRLISWRKTVSRTSPFSPILTRSSVASGRTVKRIRPETVRPGTTRMSPMAVSRQNSIWLPM